MSIEDIFRAIGSIFCHQITSRSLMAEGGYLPFCSRDTGIYTGFLFSMAYIYIKSGNKTGKIPPNGISLFLAGIMILTVADGMTSYAGLRQTTNEIRLITGIMFGVSAAFLLIPLRNFDPDRTDGKPVIKSMTELIPIMLIVTAYSILLLKTDTVPWIIASSISIAGFLILIYRIIDTVFRIATSFRGIKAHFAVIISFVFFMTAMYFVSNFLLKNIKEVLFSLIVE